MCRVSFHKSMVYNFMLSAAGVIGNLASPVYGTPAQNTLAILDPPSKIR